MHIHPIQTTRDKISGYSDFFASGFHAVLRRTSIRPVESATATSPSSTLPKHMRSLSFNHGSPQATEEKRARRSSFLEFSTSLVEKLSIDRVQTPSPPPRKRPCARKSSLMAQSDVWITTGGPFSHPYPYPFENGDVVSIDPFASSPETKSIFVDLVASETFSSRQVKRESFLSLSDGSVVSLVSTNAPATPTAPRARPMSLPPIMSPIAWRKKEAISFPWIDEDEDENWTLDEVHIEDPANRIDWRQFHVEVLSAGD